MALSSLRDDLLVEFREEKAMVHEQVRLLDPLATALRKPAARRIVNKMLLVVVEIFCYLLCIGALASIFLINNIEPFSFLMQTLGSGANAIAKGVFNISYIQMVLYSALAVTAIFSYATGRMAGRIRQKNNILQLANKNIKVIMEQQLRRKAAIEAIEQRHLTGLPDGNESIFRVPVNDVPNPGYEVK
jgi:hypothetical protein